MRELPDLLFYGTDLSQVLRANLDQAKRDVDQIPEKQFVCSSDEEVAEHVYSKREVAPLTLHDDRMEMDTQETQVDVRHDFNRAVFDKTRPCMIAGVRITVSVPFSGDANLWRCQPSTFTLNPPRGHVQVAHGNNGGHIEIAVESPSDSVGDGDRKSVV